MFALPSLMVESLPHISEPYWYPLWDICQEARNAGALSRRRPDLARKLTFPEWDGYTPYQQHAAFTVPTSAWPAQIVPQSDFLGHRLQVSALEMGVCRNRHRLGRAACRLPAITNGNGANSGVTGWIESRAN